MLYVVGAAQPAAELHRDTYSADKFAKDFAIASVRLGKGAIEINYMKHASAIFFKTFRHPDRITIIDCRVFLSPLGETNALTLPQVNRWND